MKSKNGLPPVHPGEIIKEDILPSVGLSVTAAAKALGVSRQMLHDILAARKPLSAVMCLKVYRLFGCSPEVWMRLQAAHDLKKAEQNKKVMERVARIVPVKPVEEVTLRPRRGATPLQKERGVWVFRTGKPLTADETEETLRNIRAQRHRQNAGESH